MGKVLSGKLSCPCDRSCLPIFKFHTILTLSPFNFSLFLFLHLDFVAHNPRGGEGGGGLLQYGKIDRYDYSVKCNVCY